MVIKASAAAEIRQQIAALTSGDDLRRESAIARLAVIGARAVDRLVAAYDGTPDRSTRVAVLRALESMPDPRVLALARDALTQGGDVAVAAAAVLRGLAGGEDEASATSALDALVTTVLEATAEHRVRLAAYEALQDLPEAVRAPIAAALAADPERTMTLGGSHQSADAEAIWRDAMEGTLPDQPSALREAFDAHAATAPLGVLQKLIDLVRVQEGAAGEAHRPAWLALRGSLHQALALRGSRVALYDLREALEGAAAPLPASFLAALHVVGDRTCLDALAAAFSRSAGSQSTGSSQGNDARWRQQIAAAFDAIVKRERLSKRHAEIKRLATRWPAAITGGLLKKEKEG